MVDFVHGTGVKDGSKIGKQNPSRRYAAGAFLLVNPVKQWNRADPPSCHEMRRNNTIEELQGTRNQFIDHPKRVENLEF